MARKSPEALERNRQYCKKYYAEHKAEVYQMVQDWRRRPENREKVLAWRKRDWKQRYAKQAEIELARIAKWKEANKGAIALDSNINVIIEKLAFIDAYGGACACCGDDHFEFLTADHVLGNGSEKRRNGEKFGYDLYRSLRLRGYPKDEYRLLCMDCNFSYGRYGYCPHQFESQEYGLSACG